MIPGLDASGGGSLALDFGSEVGDAKLSSNKTYNFGAPIVNRGITSTQIYIGVAALGVFIYARKKGWV